MIYVIATLRIRADKREAFLAGARAVVAATAKEEGCLFYDLHQSISDPDRYVFVERWTSHDALAAHFKAPHLQVWREIARQCMSQPTEVEIITPADVEKR
ncbi:MAG: antibiotic biosynthesis monooxygenase [Methylobacteriaceae bacterium]|nr:antibiotic biosynthesis monooxygenase [Methylobacteriaceae bacterium]